MRLLLALAPVFLALSCSLPPFASPEPAGWNLTFDEGRSGEQVPAILSLAEGGGMRSSRALAEGDFVKGRLDKIELRLKDEKGLDLEMSLAELPADDQWVLLRLSGVREFAAARMAAWIWSVLGHWSPRIALVECSLNSYDTGSWLLAETVSRGDLRIPIKKLEPEDSDSWNIQGGYIYKLERMDRFFEDGTDFLTTSCLVGHVSYPDWPTLIQHNYIAAFHNGFESACFKSPGTAISAAINDFADIPFFVDWIVVQELTMLSPLEDTDVRFYKDRGEKLRPCPAPDYRDAFNGTLSERDLVTSILPWFEGLLRYPSFRKTLHERWFDLRAESLSDEGLRRQLRGYGVEYLVRFGDVDAVADMAAMEIALIRRARFLDTVL